MMDKKYNIVGATGKVYIVKEFINRALEFQSNSNYLLQFIDAEFVMGREHVQWAIDHAIRAFERKDNISANLAMEILIYTAGQLQIQAALNRIGIKDGCEKLVIVADGRINLDELLTHLNLKREDEVLEFNESKLRKFGISESEIAACDKEKIKDLILERVAMVDVKK